MKPRSARTCANLEAGSLIGRSFSRPVGTFLDKYRLELGEASEVVITGDMMDQAILGMKAELGEDDTPTPRP